MYKQEISHIRTNYQLGKLTKSEMPSNPIEQFDIWIKVAIADNCPDPTAMTLATSTFDGKPSARIVLLKEYDNDGFTFFTNYDSSKGKQILQNPYGALVFFWPQLQRQVRIEGVLRKIDEEKSDAYFNSRPQRSKIGAWASPQSKPIKNRRYLEELNADFREEFSKKEINRPPNWGGYILEPQTIEFWQGRPNRLHDRMLYTLINGDWEIERLAP